MKFTKFNLHYIPFCIITVVPYETSSHQSCTMLLIMSCTTPFIDKLANQTTQYFFSHIKSKKKILKSRLLKPFSQWGWVHSSPNSTSQSRHLDSIQWEFLAIPVRTAWASQH